MKMLLHKFTMTDVVINPIMNILLIFSKHYLSTEYHSKCYHLKFFVM